MKENKIYWNRNKTCTRIIRAFTESENKAMTTREIFYLMLDQKTHQGANCRSNFTVQKVAQILNKYPFFEKSGIKYAKSMLNNTMQVCVWRLTALGEEE